MGMAHVVGWNYFRFALCVFFPVVSVFDAISYLRNRKYMVKQKPEETVELSERELLNQILQTLRTSGRFHESIQPGSPIIPVDKWPEHLVSVQTMEGKHVGFGFFLAIMGGLRFVSCAHVIKAVCKGGKLHTPTATLALLDSFTIKGSGSLDAVIIDVPNNYPTKLGVKKLHLAKTPGHGTAVNIFGYINGIIVRTIGVVSGKEIGLLFQHTASTISGHCGSPMIVGGKVIGIHTQSDHVGRNYALSLDFLIDEKESYDAEDKYLFEQNRDLSEDEIRENLIEKNRMNLDYWVDDADEGNEILTTKGKWGKTKRIAFRESEMAYRKVANMGSWTESGDMETLDSLKKSWGIKESAVKAEDVKPVFQKAEVAVPPTLSQPNSNGEQPAKPSTRAEKKKVKSQAKKMVKESAEVMVQETAPIQIPTKSPREMYDDHLRFHFALDRRLAAERSAKMLVMTKESSCSTSAPTTIQKADTTKPTGDRQTWSVGATKSSESSSGPKLPVVLPGKVLLCTPKDSEIPGKGNQQTPSTGKSSSASSTAETIQGLESQISLLEEKIGEKKKEKGLTGNLNATVRKLNELKKTS